MKSQPSAPHVVIVTIHDDPSHRIAAREAGADGFITKSDFTLQVLDLLRDLAEGDKPPPVDLDSTVPRGQEQS